jgi:Mce-associated membrane protein
MSESRPPRRRVAGERSRARRAEPGDVPATEPVATLPPTATEEPTAEAPATETRTTEPTGAPSPGAPVTETRAGPRWPVAVAALLAVLLVAGLAAAAVLFYRVRAADDASAARRDAVAAARSNAQAILSYDHRKLDADFATAGKVLTGKFKKDYARTTSTVVRPSAEQYKVVVKAEVTAASVVRSSAHEAVVLLYVDQTTTSTRLEGPKVDLNRVRMTLVEKNGKWLVSALDAL